ncbi:M20 family metallopeptidase [Haladaptatus sp. GCM10025707]|uniref:M20 family metallopeptidase n=1 Tax=unclassified Haladaptatus TaxID=2622732 RepID=UPI0023E75D27|nr:M20 family metallopeptidase [Haladaptatus sp. QDMS2]
MTDELTELIQDLVRIETENPPGNEAAAAEYIHDWFRDQGIESWLVEEPYPDRPQVAARVGDGDPTIVLNGHIDVVPAGDRDQWTYDPYGGEIADGKLYGRGSVDMKAQVAIAMVLARDLAPEFESGNMPGSLVVHAAIGEETGEPGTKSLLEEGYDGDYGVVLEPTKLRTATSEKGLAWYEFSVEGTPSHASRPDQGTNAIMHARPLLDAIEAYDAELRTRTDPLVEKAYATVTKFEAGTKENVVPERAVITIDRRILPGEPVEGVDAEIDDLVAEVARDHDVDISWERIRTYEAAEIDVDSPLADVFRKHSAELGGVDPEPWGIQASTDVRNFVNDADIEAITWGPGDLSRAHKFDEYIELAEVETGYDVLDRAVREVLTR